MTTLLTINTGSTSVKLALFALEGGGAPTERARERHDGGEFDPREILNALAAKVAEPPKMIVHRIVHGGTRFSQPTLVNSEVLAAIEALTPLAPLHNPTALRWVRAALEVFGRDTRQLAVFDTAYFAQLPRVAAEYALPLAVGVAHGVRRYGFHGLAHESLWRKWCALYPRLPAGGRLITLQLGGGCSIAALERGRPLDTSMGFSPLEGLVMATRCGDLDPAVLPYLERELALSGDAVVELLEKHAGLAGLSGTNAGPAELFASPEPQHRFAVELYCYRIRKYLGAYIAVLGGCDGIVFGGGVGEHVPAVRAASLQGLGFLGVLIDASRNEAARGAETRISCDDAPIKVHVLTSDEEAMLATAGAALLRGAL